MKGTVYKSTGSWYIIKDENGFMRNGRMKGVFKMEDISSTNPIAVGDKVDIETESETENSVTITNIYPRRNYINRQSPHSRYQHHIIASNLDQSLLVATFKEPKTSQGFIDRFLVASEAYHVPAVIVFNKADIYKKKELDKYEEWKAMYGSIGYTVLLASMKEQTGIEAIAAQLKNKTTVISGHSGVGKSSLLNSILPALQLRTQQVSDWSGKGLHTTTFAEMYDLAGGGAIIDTPGMREFGIFDISKQELSHYFPEMRDRLANCHFNNCLHIDEPGCAIKEAVAEGLITENRYVSYYNILESINEKGY